MPSIIDFSNPSSVRSLSVNEDNIGVAYQANLYLPIFSLATSKVIRKYEVSNQVAGIHFTHKKKHVFYAIDDSFGLHTFDTRSDKKKKIRLNPECENHNVVATALSPNNDILAVASATFAGGILDVRGSSRRKVHHAHVVSFYDTRMATDPVTSYYKHFTADITGMEYYTNGNDLIIGDQSGAVRVFDTTLRDEDNAIRWERYVKGPITKVGVINKRIVYTISDRSEATAFIDNKGKVEVLFGAAAKHADKPIVGTSKAMFKKPEWCVGLIKGINDQAPLVAVHGVENEQFISLTAMNQEGVRQAEPRLSYQGHTGEVKCMTVTPELLLTGGEDGKVIVQIADFKNPKFGEDQLDHHHPLTLNRDTQAESDDEEDSEGGSSPDDGPSTSTAPPKKKVHKHKKKDQKEPKEHKKEPSTPKDKKEPKPSSSSSSKPKPQDKEPKKEAKEHKEHKKEAKEPGTPKVHKELKEHKKEAKKLKEHKKELKEPTIPKDKKDLKPSTSSSSKPKESKEPKEHKKEALERKEHKKELKEPSTPKAHKEHKEHKKGHSTPKTPSASQPSTSSAKPKAPEEKPFDEEREKRRLMKLTETPEQRAERKRKAREERKKEEGPSETKRPRID